jgi:hypothetical protein
MLALLWIPIGLGVGLWLPRKSSATRLALSGALVVLGCLNFLLSTQAPALLVGAALAAALSLAVGLAHRFPRVTMPPLLIVGLGSTLTVLSVPPSRMLGLGLAVVGIGLVALGTVRVALGVRLLCAAVGARLLMLATPWTSLWLEFAVMALLCVASARTAPAAAPPARDGRRARRITLATALALLLAVGSTPWLAAELPASSEGPANAEPRLTSKGPANAEPRPTEKAPYAARREKLRQAAPSGGLIWPLPSEAILWSETDAFPWFENLDARYLSGKPAGLVKLPGTSPLRGAFWLHRPIVDLRLHKDESELADLRFAAHATVAALTDSLALYRAGVKEQAIADAITAGFKAHGCEGESFTPIVATGAHAAKPHQFEKTATLKEGELVVTDIGCYKNHYASDITRTIPVGGRFSERTRKLYEAVYAAQQAALSACRPGVAFLGKSPDGAPSLDQVSRSALKAHGVDSKYPHTLGHTVGLFVHDVTAWPFVLKPGMVITLEPGLYLENELGIRIEDTYVVTETGCELVTAGFPADPDSVEAIAGKGR